MLKMNLQIFKFMKSYLAYKNELTGVYDLREMIKTLEKISLSKVYIIQKIFGSLNEYSREILIILNRLNRFYSKQNHVLLKKREEGKKILVIISGNKSLVGSLWDKTYKLFEKNKNDYDNFIIIGEKILDFFQKNDFKFRKYFSLNEEIDETEIAMISKYIINIFKIEEIKEIDIIFADFINITKQKVVIKQFLPFSFDLEEMYSEKKDLGFPIFLPNKEEIFLELIDKYIEFYLYSMLIKVKLSELSARTLILENASKKSKEVIKKIKKDYMKDHRAQINQRQIEAFTHRNISNK